MQFAHFDSDAFLRDTWQKRPLLIRNPWASWVNPLDGDDLAGLACEDFVESRLVVREGPQMALESGPFPEDRFAALDASPSTLLVQAVDHHVPEVAALIEPFRFVPDWRIDDVMVSYATDGGGVGPHFDQYDVFLIQGQGRRVWRVGAPCDADTPLLPHDELRLIADFEALEEWTVEPGDIVYVPARFAHDGIALGDDCMTYSIGFRAPSRAELIEAWSGDLADCLPDDDRYADPGLPPQPHPAEITPEALAKLHAMVLETLSDKQAFARWFGAWNSQPKYAETDWQSDEATTPDDVQALLAQGTPLLRNPASRFAFIRQDGGGLTLFVDGNSFDCASEDAALAELICAGPTCCPQGPSPAAAALIAALINQGSMAFEDDEE